MPLTLLHTSDWHLGHTILHHTREEEHRVFLAWLLQTIGTERPDALLIAGDVFDGANPSAAAQRLLYEFLGEVRGAHPALGIVLVGGNHDSAARLDAPSPLLSALRIHVVGGLRTWEESSDPDALDLARLLIPLRGSDGEIAAWVAAIPFLRSAELPACEDEEGSLVGGVRAIYQQVLDAARACRSAGQAILATGHCYMAGTTISEASERKIMGNQHALPADIFSEDVAYVALGHLHRPQQVSGHPHRRYSGAPLPFDVGERHYPHQVLKVTLHGECCVDVVPIRVPPAVVFLRVPDADALPLHELEAALQALPPVDPALPAWKRPFLEVAVRIDTPTVGVRQRVEKALADKGYRLVRIHSELPRQKGERVVSGDLSVRSPEDVFRQCWEKRFPDGPLPGDLLAAFQEIETQARESV